jgi:cytochrome c-type biogenesis protein CcmH
MILRIIILILALAVEAAVPLRAVQFDEILPDPVLEGRARAISSELRCMVCQNQSIDDSEAPLARDLRLLVRERLKAGDTDQQVVDFMVARYGEFVLLKPRLGWHTLILWVAPFLALLGGFLTILLAMRNRSGSVPAQPAGLTEAERTKLVAIERAAQGR